MAIFLSEEEQIFQDKQQQFYYGFTSTQFNKDFEEEVLKIIKSEIYDELVGVTPDAEKIYQLYLDKAKKPLEKFKEETKKVFAIPGLPEPKHYSDKDIRNLSKEVEDLQMEYVREKLFIAKCKNEKEEIEKLVKPTIEQVNSLLKNNELLQKSRKVIEENLKNVESAHKQHLKFFLKGQYQLLPVEEVHTSLQ